MRADALVGAVSQELLSTIRSELRTGICASESKGEVPMQGKRMVGQMLKNTRFSKLPNKTLW